MHTSRHVSLFWLVLNAAMCTAASSIFATKYSYKTTPKYDTLCDAAQFTLEQQGIQTLNKHSSM